MTITSLWCNVSVNVVANSNWIRLLISAPKVHWRVQPTAARWCCRFNRMNGALCALHVSLNNSSTRTVHKCLKRKNGHLITLQIWMEWRCVWKRCTKLFWNLIPKPKMVSELKVTLEKIWDNFSQVQLIKLYRVLPIIRQQYVNGDGRHSKHLSVHTQKVFTRHLCCFE